MNSLRIVVLAAIALVLTTPLVRAHAFEPGYLEITSMDEERYRVFWRKPDVQGMPMKIDPRLPSQCNDLERPAVSRSNGAWTATWITVCSGGLAGGEITIEGLDQTRTDVLVRYPDINKMPQTQRLTPGQIRFSVPENPRSWDVVKSYVPLGIDHILAGVDHLLFVFALLLLIPDRWRLIGAITAFTVAHSITMAAATLGWIALPPAPVEAIIALSIMFVASELLKRGGAHKRFSERYPWTVSFIFGLLHGFGFAGALRDIGLPVADVPLALLSFNLGVEIGQLLFVVMVLIFGALLRLVLAATKVTLKRQTRASTLCAYGIGGISAYWLIDRVSGF